MSARRRRCVLLEVVLGVVLAVGAGLLVCWLALLSALLLVQPSSGILSDAVRLLPDLVRLATRLAKDRSLGAGTRWRLGLLAGYLASPIDLIPDLIPVLGYADDAILVVWVLRSVVRRAGVATVRRHWPGSEAGFDAVLTLCGMEHRPARPV